MECSCFTTQRPIVHFRWNLIWKSILFVILQNSIGNNILTCEIMLDNAISQKSLKDKLLLLIYFGPRIHNNLLTWNVVAKFLHLSWLLINILIYFKVLKPGWHEKVLL